MSWLGRLLGKSPPRIPTGGRAYVAMDDLNGTAWSVRVVIGDDPPTHRDKAISPTFERQTVAEDYLAWVTGEAATFEYPADGAA